MFNTINLKKLFVGFLLLLGTSVSLIAQNNPQPTIVGQDYDEKRVITTAVPFVGITPDARSGAMGDVGVAISPDANSVFSNPAKLAFIENKSGFAVSYTPWLAKIINDMSLAYLSGYYKITKEQAVAVSMRYFDLGEILFTDDNNLPQGDFRPKEFAIDGTYSRMLTENLSLGITARYIHSNLTGGISQTIIEAKPGNTAAADVSAFYTKDIMLGHREAVLASGLNISNIGAKLSYSNQDNKDFIPINFRLGTSLKTYIDQYNSITVAFDVNKLMVPSQPVYERDGGAIVTDADGNAIIERGKDPGRSLLSGMFGSFSDAPDGFSEEMQELMLALGIEYWYSEKFAVRAGYFNEHENKGNRKYFTFGIGFRYNLFGIDFAYLVPQEQNHPLAETLRFSLLFDFIKESIQDDSVTD